MVRTESDGTHGEGRASSKPARAGSAVDRVVWRDIAILALARTAADRLEAEKAADVLAVLPKAASFRRHEKERRQTLAFLGDWSRLGND